MRVLLLSIYYPPEVGANSRIVEGLSKELQRLGDEVTVLTGFPHYPDGVIRAEYRGKLFIREDYDGKQVLRNWLIVGPRENKWLRIANNLSCALSSIIGGLFSGRQDVIYVYSPPLFLGFTAYVLSRLKRVPFVFNVQDVYPEIAVRYGVIRNLVIIRPLEAFERWVYRKANHITVISEGFEMNLISKEVNPDKITVIPNWVETDLFIPRSKDNPFSHEFNLNRRFVAMYAGNIGYLQGLETVVKAAHLLSERTDIHFVIVGDGVKKVELMQLAESYHLRNLTFIPFQPRTRMPDVVASADVCFVILGPEKSKTTIQSKTYEIMAMERPIIASVDLDGDNWALIEEAQAGIWVQPGDPGAIADAVLQLYADETARLRLGKNGRRYVLMNNASRVVCEKYRELLHAQIGSSVR